MKNWLFVLSFLLTSQLWSQKLIEVVDLGIVEKQTLIADYGFVLASFDVQVYRVHYTSVGTDYTEDTLSGVIVYPIRDDYKLPLISYQHSTVSERTDVPSNQRGDISGIYAYATNGFAICASDYLGLGNSRGFHAFADASAVKSACLDLITISRNFLLSKSVELNNQLFATGYSEGGHATLALMDTLESDPTYSSLITAATALSGPYDLATTMLDRVLSDEPYPTPAYLPLIVLGMKQRNPAVFSNLTAVFKPEYLTPISDFYTEKTDLWTMNGQLFSLLDQNFGALILKNMLTESYLSDVESNPNHPLRIALKKNSVHQFGLTTPMKLYYCIGDDQIPYQNTEVACLSMKSNGATDLECVNLGDDLDHTTCQNPSFLQTFLFFNAKTNWVPLSVVSKESDLLKITPTIVTSLVSIELMENEEGILSIYSIDGKLLTLEKMIQSIQLDLSHFEPGHYFGKFKNDNKIISFRFSKI